MRIPTHPPSDRRPVIGLTSSAHVISIGSEPYAIRYTPAALDDAVLNAGGLPIHLPILGDDEIGEALHLVDGLILSGGCDVDPRLYGGERREPPPVPDYDLERDASERALIEAILVDRVPLLGICRGLQILNVARGGSLVDDDGHYYQRVPRAGPTHPLLIEPGSRLEAIFGSRLIEVNSVHNQMIERLGSGVVVTARSEDGVIEAIELENDGSLMIGVQWHPEAMAADDQVQRRLFAALVTQARVRATRRRDS
jgi:putative glutamine amidotransferase